MEDINSFVCYEISPGSLKGYLRVFNPFERIFRDFIHFLDKGESSNEEFYNEENYNKFVRNYYIYKKQFKKYGLTFYVRDGNENENKTSPSKIFFLPKNILKGNKLVKNIIIKVKITF